jgi:hypothetical protein
VGGNFFTRIGAGGMPFLLPLFYQVGLGYTPIQSGLLIIPQPLSAIIFRLWVPKILTLFGYRKLLLGNTVLIGIFIMLFSLITPGTSIGWIILIASGFGAFSSLQYTSMNTLAYADISGPDTSMASTILSTVQQMSMSFGVAAASLITSFFIHDRLHSSPSEMIEGLHRGFITLGLITIVSAAHFSELETDDGSNVSHHHKKMKHPRS